MLRTNLQDCDPQPYGSHAESMLFMTEQDHLGSPVNASS